ncbi:hypothetical protein M422DRAFT_774503 [Sphaerobolus stellatus SS14]|nr:hypothetical protein M422DRAFT_774503 [Sphaerobolus stellatus SS14]
MFKFTFSVGGSGFNPFAAQSEQRERQQVAIAPQTSTRKLPAPPRRSIPLTLDDENAPPISRKRGWAPSTSSPSAPVSQRTETNGWLDTPSRYMEAASQSHRSGGETTAFEDELPPAKRRRTLTDSIISTALSAALIGTTVGMTAYRMWRDRGKTTDNPLPGSMDQPPPPYEREEWVDEMAQTKPAARGPRMPRKQRPIARRTPRRRVAPITMSPARTPLRIPSPNPAPPEIKEITSNEPDDLDDQMDWMNDKLRQLIEEGQKALGKEVVVMSDDPDDKEDGAVDDGLDGWEEVEARQAKPGPSSPISANFRRKKARQLPSLTLSPSVSPPTRYGNTFPASYTDRSLSPVKRKYPRLGRSQENVQDIKVLYEPSAPISELAGPSDDMDDDDSRSLSERLEKVRQAYHIY